MEILQKNLEVLQKKNAELVNVLINLDVNDLPYEIFIEQENLLTLNLIHKKTFQPLYLKKPQLCIEKQIEELKIFEEYPYLYFFGMGNGCVIQQLLCNPKHKRLMVIEPDITILYVILHFIDFSDALQEDRLVLFASSQIHQTVIGPLLDTFARQRYAKLYTLQVMSSYYDDAYADEILKINRIFADALVHIMYSVGNDAKDSLIGLEHHCMNLNLMIRTSPVFEFIKKAKNTDVAVLVATGPSLAKQLPLLKEVASDVTIVAVDASFPILHKHGIKPDIVVSMEREELTGRFFKDTPKEAFNGVVFALSSLQHPEVIDNIKGGTIQMSMRPFGYMRVMDLAPWGYFGLGMSAANMAFEIIFHSKFKTCVLIGQDLAYGDDGMSHSSGHIFGVDEVKHAQNDLYVEAYGGGKTIRTTQVWSIFRNYFEKDINDTKDMMDTINATEGGARIYGAIERSFADVISSYITKKVPKKPISLQVVNDQYLKQTEDKLNKKLLEIDAYLATERNNVEGLFLTITSLCEKADKEHVALSELEFAEQSVVRYREKIHEPMFEQIIWHIAQSMLISYEVELAKVEVRFITNDEEHYCKTLDWLKLSQKWLFALAGCIDAIQTAMKRKGSHYSRNIQVNGASNP